MNDLHIRLEELMPLIQERLAQGDTVRLTPQGSSMLPMLRGGRDQVVLAAVPGRLKRYDLPLYRRKNGQYVLHRVVRAGETYTCIGDNQFALEHGIRQDQLLAVVAAFSRNGREYSVESIPYRAYCRLWHWSRPVRRVLRSLRARWKGGANG